MIVSQRIGQMMAWNETERSPLPQRHVLVALEPDDFQPLVLLQRGSERGQQFRALFRGRVDVDKPVLERIAS